MQFEDATLVLRSLDGDADAFAALVRRYQRAVYATAFYYAGRYGAAEDIAQEAFWAAYRNLPRLSNPELFGPWLKAVTCRTAANWLRRNDKWLRTEAPAPDDTLVSIEDVRANPRDASEQSERFTRIEQAIDALPERHRLPVVLRYLQELSYKDIAEFTGDSVDEIRGILQRAGRQLRDNLADIDSDRSEGERSWPRARR